MTTAARQRRCRYLRDNDLAPIVGFIPRDLTEAEIVRALIECGYLSPEDADDPEAVATAAGDVWRDALGLD